MLKCPPCCNNRLGVGSVLPMPDAAARLWTLPTPTPHPLACTLQDPHNPELRAHVLRGEIRPDAFVRMTATELASKVGGWVWRGGWAGRGPRLPTGRAAPPPPASLLLFRCKSLRCLPAPVLPMLFSLPDLRSGRRRRAAAKCSQRGLQQVRVLRAPHPPARDSLSCRHPAAPTPTPGQELAEYRKKKEEEALKMSVLDAEAAAKFSTAAALDARDRLAIPASGGCARGMVAGAASRRQREAATGRAPAAHGLTPWRARPASARSHQQGAALAGRASVPLLVE